MAILIDTLPTVLFSTVFFSKPSLSKHDVDTDDNDTSINLLPNRSNKSCSIYGDVSPRALVVLWFGHRKSSLRATLVESLTPEDITLILFSTEEQLWYWLNTNSSVRIAALVIETNINTESVISRSHAYSSVRSILVRCRTTELMSLQRFSRSYIKLDGVYNDDTRLLIKLIFDLALFSEELGDEQREQENNELEAQRNYDRTLKLCALVKKF